MKNARIIAASFLAVLILTFVLVGGDTYYFERISFALHPTAGKALALGQRHFDAKHPSLYDIQKAKSYFEKAYRIDREYPFVNHELARTAFLDGKFNTALMHINREITLHGDSVPNSYYIRGLIQGYRGDYDRAAADYAYYLRFDPTNWAAINDYAWVLLKDGNAQDAQHMTARALAYFPENPWLLNSHAIAMYDLGEYEIAKVSAEAALTAANSVTEQDWLTAYPGNDPLVAAQGMQTLRTAIERNIHMATDALTNNALQ